MVVVMGAVVMMPSRSMFHCYIRHTFDVPARWVDERGTVVAASVVKSVDGCCVVEGIARKSAMIENDWK